MAITVDWLKSKGIEEDVAKEIFAERGKEIEAEKEKTNKVKEDLKTANDNLANITAELNTLKQENASADDWKNKFEELDKKVKEEAEARETERKNAEKQALIDSRYNAVTVDKDGKSLNWSHPAIAESYKAKFAEAIEDKSNIGKSDKEIFAELTKDDATAFTNITTVTLAGGKPMGNEVDDSQVRAIMGLPNK